MNIVLMICGRFCYWIIYPVIWVARRITRRARVLVVSKDEFLVVRPFIGSGEWTLPGGGVRLTESPDTGAARELYEEVGLRVSPGELVEGDNSDKSAQLFGLSLKQKPELKLQKYEIRDYKWIKINDSSEYKLSSFTKNAISWWHDEFRRDIITKE